MHIYWLRSPDVFCATQVLTVKLRNVSLTAVLLGESNFLKQLTRTRPVAQNGLVKSVKKGRMKTKNSVPAMGSSSLKTR